ncbi:MAG: bifunctional (p)ppGpp synthetase/guanosine-3',5'-bis(diphosphate) 3'-pyrophosphohydrolase [SAR202 cluster bacterium]|nr:bifunctional (p)ppGpp synthetase/guanosine-3',5'-bis(diphosphate) 3'-pyrophosphohydrolase [SAR202 cluster bacterium]|tara:strand:+ start:2350 stop:4548 length:2199 start_codon:yes stop_codon:yes gene_type:complete
MLNIKQEFLGLQNSIEYLPKKQVLDIEKAFAFADASHHGQLRKSGEPYIVHPLAAAQTLAELRLDSETLQATLLHDVIEDCGVTVEQLSNEFSPQVAKLVDGVTKLTQLDLPDTTHSSETNTPIEQIDVHLESLRKMFISMAEDVRVVLIKLADRLHNMETLDALPEASQKRIAQETLDIYSPLAHRLGIYEIKWRLDDLSFKHLDPNQYKQISRLLAVKRTEREIYINNIVSIIESQLNEANVLSEVTGRPKNIYSIFQKLRKQTSSKSDVEIDEIYDLYALRILVNSEEDCYRTLGIVHKLWSPIPGQFDDYISNPKDTLYQSLHTTVYCEENHPLEVQIKTFEMHELAEYGVAAHWKYKQGVQQENDFDNKMDWLRQVLDWQRDSEDTAAFVESIKDDLFQDQVFVYTPKGKIIELATGSTSVDFAYKIHTELGNSCIGSKVNGKLVPLDSALSNGDTVEILVSKIPRGPSHDWLNPDLGFVKSALAREKVKQWFKKQTRSTNVQIGREIAHNELDKLDIQVSENDLIEHFGYPSITTFYEDLGSGKFPENQLKEILRQTQIIPDINATRYDLPISSPSSGITVEGTGDLLTRIARCCNPMPGDDIIGYVTRTRGVSIHKPLCNTLESATNTDHLINVSWGEARNLFPVRIRITSVDRVGLLRDVTTKVSDEGVNIASVITQEHSDGSVTMDLTIHANGVLQLNNLFTVIRSIVGVEDVTRIHFQKDSP